MPITVLVVDDQALIRAGLTALLRAAPDIEVVGEAKDGEEAMAQAAALRPDVILMDIRMPGVGGITATKRILATGSPARILVLTTFDLDDYVYEALSAGAAGFVLKEIEPARLLAAIHTVATGDTLFAPTVTRRLIEAYLHQQSPPGPTPAHDLGCLTAREREVLQLVGTGIGNAEIAQRLVVSEGTVKTHLNRVMTKLDLSSRAQAVVTAYETGLVVARSTGNGIPRRPPPQH
ncbi:response regulator [Actinokineospora iranica]|uniref:DNA-binding response regulator, NarL/FixJ family, contains REC and HTH domains n=1 Tax=Actinokineospora iranica TaxID=1271860 RepID=A0A1G6QJ24_9PSEU|nr:response regulator transcription factor [Actinokineospora iranica]SDC92308.1 DNA-binding response regulator, NarL/FixJ family, contains REC and HTH domains [Actinokineospora iranica]